MVRFFVCCGGFLFMYVMNKTSALTEVRMAQIVILHEEGYTERDIAANLYSSQTPVYNVIVKFSVDGTFHYYVIL